MALTERQQRLIDTCKTTGYGWSLFAKSVEASGRCSAKQETTLINMVQSIKRIQHRNNTIRRHGWVGSDWDQHNLDAQSAGYESNDYCY